jgi:hypothetical protein
VLGVDGDHAGAGGLGERHHELASHHQALLVGERQIDALAERRHGGPEPGGAHQRVQHEVAVGAGDQLDQPFRARQHLSPGPGLGGPRRGRLVRERDPAHAMGLGLLHEQVEAG